MSTTSGEEAPSKGIRRKESEVNFVPRLSSLGLKEALEGILESGYLADVIFIVGGGHKGQGDDDHEEIGRREIVAHKLILSARSEVFRAMMEERWSNGPSSLVNDSAGENRNIVRIEIDSTINANAFEQIIKFIYKDDVTSCLKSLEFEDIFDFRSLAEMYGFIQLKDAASMKIAHDLVNDYRKCYLTLEQEIVDQDLRAVAFSVLKRNLREAYLEDNDLTADVPSRWTEQIWENVLMDEGLELAEILLFQGLLRWKEHDPSTREEEDFKKLLGLIRFPIMSPTEFLAIVRPTGVLSSEELLDNMQHQSDYMTPASQKPKLQFSMDKRGKRFKWVTSFKELMQALDDMPVIEDQDGAVEIFLLPGDYSGVVDVNKDFVKLTGFGPYTILQGRESGIKLSSIQATLSNFTLQGTMTILHVTGSCNVVRNIVGTSKNSMFALAAKGISNIFENFSFSYDDPSAVQLENYELDCAAKRTELTTFLQGQGIELKLSNYGANLRFVWSYGPQNKFSNFNCVHLKNRKGEIPLDCQTTFVVAEDDNVIENVQFGEGSALFDESSLSNQPSSHSPPKWARLIVHSTGVRVSDSCFAQIHIYDAPSRQHHFKRVVVAKTIVVNGSDHKFEDCRYGEMKDNGENTVTSVCVAVPEWLVTPGVNKTI